MILENDLNYSSISMGLHSWIWAFKEVVSDVYDKIIMMWKKIK